MKNCVLTGTMAIFACCTLIGLAQDGPKPAGTKAAEKSDQEKGRLPANYGKLGLTEAQKNSIYEVQKKYKSQLDDLEKQLDALKSKRDGEVEAVLSDAQRKILKDLVDAAKEAKKPKKAPAPKPTMESIKAKAAAKKTEVSKADVAAQLSDMEEAPF